MRLHNLNRIFISLGLGAVLAVSATAQKLEQSAINEIRAVVEAKQSFTKAETKMSSDLVFAGKAARLESLGAVPNRFANTVHVDQNGRVLVDIKAKVTTTLLRQITGAGGEIAYASVSLGSVRANVPLGVVDRIAGNPDVITVRKAAMATTNSSAKDLVSSPQFGGLRATLVSAEFPQIASTKTIRSSRASIPGLNFFIGSVTSQGYISHRANQVINMGFDGTGVRVGVLSDSASAARVAALIATGDLPADTVVLPGEDGSPGSDEGTAMMEIVHDLAPGAKLFFATAFNGVASFASNIRALRHTYHCDIIVDDITYFEEGVFQDGPIAQAVNDVVADGANYFSSAGNSGNLTNGTSGTWQGDFVGYLPAGTGPGIITGFEGTPVLFNNFGTAAHPTYFTALTSTGADAIILEWSDPLGAAADDYDLFILNSTGTVLKAFSADSQTGTQDPVEGIGTDCVDPGNYCPALGDQVVAVLYNGHPRALFLATNRATLSIATSGATFGHNAGVNTITMAATYWGSAHRGTQPFSGFANRTETFSSDGPRKIFYHPNGAPITPGNVLFATNGGTTLQKPDLTAADGVFAKTPGFLPFFGTSAAAPHAAAIAALVKQAKPMLTNTQIKAVMTGSALDTMAVGVDRDAGYGIAMALQAVTAALALP